MRREHHRGTKLGRALGGADYVVGLHVWQPKRSVRVALDNASAHLAAGFEREVRAATGVRALRTPAEQSLDASDAEADRRAEANGGSSRRRTTS
jgi:hypothetical protein